MHRIRGTMQERFEGRVVRGESPDDCWTWSGSHFQATGYALFNRPSPKDGVWRPTVAHRVAWELYRGEIPAGLVIDHLCRNRGCVNPDHLEPVPQKINANRGMAPSAIANRDDLCLKGHPLTPENVYVRPSRPGKRECRTCMKERERNRPKRDWRNEPGQIAAAARRRAANAAKRAEGNK